MRLSIGIPICVGITYVFILSNSAKAQAIPAPPNGAIRIATYNMALNRSKPNELSSGLQLGDERPDVLLANEVDFDGGESAKLLAERYLNAKLEGLETEPLQLNHWFTAEVNTGVQSGLNLTGTGKTGKPEDAWGFGAFPGQYGMVVYSRFPLQLNNVRTFQKFLWSDMPNALIPGVGKPSEEAWKPYYSDEIWKRLRLSSKSHWDVPVNIDGRILHVLASHPTPPVFDGPEDRNGKRNHDEIRFTCDYIEGLSYMVDDQGNSGGLNDSAKFVVLGDLNADPYDGDGMQGGINRLLNSKRINASFVPNSKGAVEAATTSGQANAKHKGDPSHDTGDFNDRNPGNLRIDFVLPSEGLKVIGGGVFWPTKKEMEKLPIDVSDASDHHLVWIDIQLP
ncbi:MAG: endonuclease/exonuclease/phosphatase family protein [Pirellula sp.]|nr:endonuclease/exonuclease/phosphatase family protein [Pirellula sp.]